MLRLDSKFLHAGLKILIKNRKISICEIGFQKLRVTNDNAKRRGAFMQSYNELLPKDQEQLQFILPVVSDHRNAYPDAKKITRIQQNEQWEVETYILLNYSILYLASCSGKQIKAIYCDMNLRVRLLYI